MQQTDHDLLIKLNTKVNIMCVTLNNFQKDNHTQHLEIIECINRKVEKVHERVDKHEKEAIDCRGEVVNKLDLKLDSNYFRWIFRSIIAILIVGTIFTTKNIITNNDRFNNIETQICILHNDKGDILFPIPLK